MNTEYMKIFISCPIHRHKDCLKFVAVMNKDFINILIFVGIYFYFSCINYSRYGGS